MPASRSAGARPTASRLRWEVGSAATTAGALACVAAGGDAAPAAPRGQSYRRAPARMDAAHDTVLRRIAGRSAAAVAAMPDS